MNHEKFMKRALEMAKIAFDNGEVPVGAVIVKDGKIIAEGSNSAEKEKNPLCHSELIAINKALAALGAKYLYDCSLYVTLEPCPMCMGAILHSRLDTLVFSAFDEKTGSAGTKTDLTEIEFFKKPKIIGGYMENQSRELLLSFFKNRR